MMEDGDASVAWRGVVAAREAERPMTGVGKPVLPWGSADLRQTDGDTGP